MQTEPTKNINDTKARLVGIPLISFGITMIQQWESFKTLKTEFWWSFWLAFLNTFFIWQGLRKLMQILITKYPKPEQTQRRLLWQTSFALLYTMLVTFLVDVYCLWANVTEEKALTFWEAFGIGLIPTTIVTLAYESVFFFQAWKEGLQRTEILAKEKIQSQLEALKNQLDPHFLFNSLNTLTYLIDDSNQEAQTYVEKLADVYRYVLLSKSKDIVPLSEELDFAEAYMYLNKVRFQDNLQIDIQLKKEDLEAKVIPLCLQMLIENAIKHNIISKDKPLKIKILSENNNLIVENNLQEKRIFDNSTKVGLENINNRYRLLVTQSIVVEKEDQVFRVKLPYL